MVGQDGIAMAAWESHDLTSVVQDHSRFIAAVIELIEHNVDDPHAVRQIELTCTARWGKTA
ncbi:MAG: hypothetical protein GY798_10105 [Hyphomicrobiales bacterium]|nr:hypothetical protein [Hyphomicrobiales bacterium]